MITVLNALVAAASVLPTMAFSFGQIPSFFQTTQFFTSASQIISEILSALASGLLGALVNALFGLGPGLTP